MIEKYLNTLSSQELSELQIQSIEKQNYDLLGIIATVIGHRLHIEKILDESRISQWDKTYLR